MKNHSDVPFVITNVDCKCNTIVNYKCNALDKLFWRTMKEYTRLIYHVAAQSGTRNSNIQHIWRFLKESILMRHHSAAQNVTGGSVQQLIWKLNETEESSLMRNHTFGPCTVDVYWRARGCEIVEEYSSREIIVLDLTNFPKNCSSRRPYWLFPTLS